MNHSPTRHTVVDTTILITNRLTGVEVGIICAPLNMAIELATHAYPADNYSWSIRPYGVTRMFRFYRVIKEMYNASISETPFRR